MKQIFFCAFFLCFFCASCTNHSQMLSYEQKINSLRDSLIIDQEQFKFEKSLVQDSLIISQDQAEKWKQEASLWEARYKGLHLMENTEVGTRGIKKSFNFYGRIFTEGSILASECSKINQFGMEKKNYVIIYKQNMTNDFTFSSSVCDDKDKDQGLQDNIRVVFSGNELYSFSYYEPENKYFASFFGVTKNQKGFCPELGIRQENLPVVELSPEFQNFLKEKKFI